jgi:hypothetical protein
MTSADDWPDYPIGLAENSVSRREERCTWHGDKAHPCPGEPVKVVRDRLGRRWAACAKAVEDIAEQRKGAGQQA